MTEISVWLNSICSRHSESMHSAHIYKDNESGKDNKSDPSSTT